MTKRTGKPPATPAERMEKSRAARYERGQRQINVWAYPDDALRIRAYAARVLKERERG